METQTLHPASLVSMPEGGALMLQDVGAVSAIAREEAEIKAAMVAAHHFPRDETQAFNRLMKACARPRLADKATYKFPRGSTKVEGPSVYLAREMARCWGNVRYGLRIVATDEKTVHILGWAYDVETNSYVSAEDRFAKLVERKQNGKTVWIEPDERNLRELINKRGAILTRNCLLQLMPFDIVEAAQAEAKKTLEAAARSELKSNKEDSVRGLVKAYDDLGVTKEMLEEYLDHGLDAVNAQEIVELRQVYRSIAEGNTDRRDHFKVSRPKEPTPGSGSADLNAALAEELKKAA